MGKNKLSVSLSVMFSICSKSIRQVLTVVFLIYLYKWVSPTQIGIYLIGQTIVVVSSTFALLGMNKSAQKYANYYVANNDTSSLYRFVIKIMKWATMAVAIVSCAVYSGGEWLKSQFFSEYQERNSIIIIIAGLIIILSWYRLLLETLRGCKKFYYASFIDDLVMPIGMLIGLIVAYNVNSFVDAKILLLIYGALVSFQLTIVLFVLLKYYLNARSEKLIKLVELYRPIDDREILKYGFHTFLISSGYILLSWIDTLSLGFLDASASVALYNAANKMTTLIELIGLGMSSVLPVVYRELIGKNALKELEIMAKEVGLWLIAYSLGILGVLVYLGKDILIWVNPELVSSYIPMIILSVGCVLYQIMEMNLQILIMSGNEGKLAFAFYVCALLDAVLNFILIPVLGLVGAALSTCVTLILIAVWGYLLVRKIGLSTVGWKQSARLLLIWGVIFVPFFAISEVSSNRFFWSCGFAVVYVLALIQFDFIQKRMKWCFDIIMNLRGA